jgi:ATP-binding cassette subfamily B protein
LGKRKSIDYKRFEVSSQNHNQLISLYHGMHEIKMSNAEKDMRWRWERIQARLFQLSAKRLSIDQYQQIGSSFINELKNILITFASAISVINGELTLGEMLAIQYIIGQLNGPIQELVEFVKSSQDALISLDRVNDIQMLQDESSNTMRSTTIPSEVNLEIENLIFRYGGPSAPLVLNNIRATFEHGKVTAIVGASGSGKTTLLKLLLKFYKPNGGQISLGESNLENYSLRFWREVSAAVMQDGFIFSETIARNIVVRDERINIERLIEASKIANIHDFVSALPQGYETKIGEDGIGLSGGQRQRMLIARAVYKNPQFIFFDEATSSLDTENEKIIMGNLLKFFKGRTVVVIAHRLSTVRNADKIIVLKDGAIVEEGKHDDLIEVGGVYFSLVKNQLELGV